MLSEAMPVRIHRQPGVIRCATSADTPALSQLMSCLGTDKLLLTAADVAASLDRGHLLVLELDHGMLGAAAHVAVVETDGVRHAAFRYIAVHPSLARTGAERRMIAAMLDVCDGVRGAMATPDQLGALRREAARRISYLMMLILAMPHAIASAGTNHAAVAMLVWSALALIPAARAPRIPRAIVRHSRAARFWTWACAG